MKVITDYVPQILAKQPSVILIGIGNSGFKQLRQIERRIPEYRNKLGIDTDKVLLLSVNTDVSKWEGNDDALIYTFSIGRNRTLGQGTGIDIDKGCDSYGDQRDEFEQLMIELKIKFAMPLFVCGGGTGTGAGPEIIQSLNKLGIVQFPMVGVASRKHREIRAWQADAIQEKLEIIKSLGIRTFQPLNEKAAEMGDLRVQEAWDKMVPDVSTVPFFFIQFLLNLSNENMDLDLNDVRRVAKGVNYLHAGGVTDVASMSPQDIAAKLIKNDFYRFGDQSSGAILMLGGPSWNNKREYELFDALENLIDARAEQRTFIMKTARCDDKSAQSDYAFFLRADYGLGDEDVPSQKAWWVEGREGEIVQQVSVRPLRSIAAVANVAAATAVAARSAPKIEVPEVAKAPVAKRSSKASSKEVKRNSKTQSSNTALEPSLDRSAKATSESAKFEFLHGMNEKQNAVLGLLENTPGPAATQFSLINTLNSDVYYDKCISKGMSEADITREWEETLLRLYAPVGRFTSGIIARLSGQNSKFINATTDYNSIKSILATHQVENVAHMAEINFRLILLEKFDSQTVFKFLAPTPKPAYDARPIRNDIPALGGEESDISDLEGHISDMPDTTIPKANHKLAEGDRPAKGIIGSIRNFDWKGFLRPPVGSSPEENAPPPAAGH